jgi:hypothetical protein
MWYALEEFVYSNHPKTAVIFNLWILRASTGILSPSLIVTYTKCSRQSNLLVWGSDNLMCQICQFYVTCIGGVGSFQSPKTHCHLQSFNSMRIDRDTDSHLDFHIHQVQQAAKSISLRIRLSNVSNLSFLCDMHWRSRFIPIIQNGPLSSSILEFSEDRQGYWLPLWFSHTPSAAGSRIYKSKGQIIQCVKSVILCDIHGRNGFIPIISFPLSSSILQFSENRQGYWLSLSHSSIFTWTKCSRQLESMSLRVG